MHAEAPQSGTETSAETSADPDPPYRNPALTVGERVADLLGRMTIAEKVGQLNQRMYGWDAYTRRPGADGIELTEAFRTEVARWDGMGALYGLFRADPWSGRDHTNGIGAAASAVAAAEVQRWIREHTRLGIPVLLIEEVPHGHQAVDGTVMPVNLAVASSWDPDGYADAVARVAAEVRGRGAHVALVSALDMLTDPRWGRSEECFGEDPYLAAELTSALVRGMQGDGQSGGQSPIGLDRMAVVLKHFAGQGAGAGGLNANAAGIGPRELREIHLPAAEAGVRAGVAGLMAAYNEIDGVPCAGNRHLLTGILRDEWGFGGIVMADGGGIDRLTTLTADLREAGVLALRSGIDLSLWDRAYTLLDSALEDGLIDEALIDRSAARVLELKFRLGLFDTDLTDVTGVADVTGLPDSIGPTSPTSPTSPSGPSIPTPVPPQRSVSRSLAERSLVLLQNRDATLPLRADLRRIAVIGPNALDISHQIGDYTTVQPPGTGVCVLDGIRAAAQRMPSPPSVTYAKGCRLTASEPGPDGIDAARALAAEADVAILVLGGSSARQAETEFAANGAAIVPDPSAVPDMTCGEGVDLADITLPAAQLELARQVAATGTPTVAVLIQGRPHALSDLPESCDAILCAWYPGTEGGTAVASAVFGTVHPAGRLPVSIPQSSAVLPVTYNAKLHHHTRYVDRAERVAFPFGFGLGYARFAYAGLVVTPDVVGLDELRAGETVRVAVRVRNLGEVDGEDVVQLYTRRTRTSIWPRERELKAFRRLAIAAGEETVVDFALGLRELGVWLSPDTPAGFDVEPGTQQLTIGGLAGDLTIVE